MNNSFTHTDKRRALNFSVAVLVLFGVLCVAWTALFGVNPAVDALSAAGFKPASGAISGVKTLLDQLKNNIVWLAASLAALALSFIGLLLMIGHSRAMDIAAKVGGGIFLIVAAPGIVA